MKKSITPEYKFNQRRLFIQHGLLWGTLLLTPHWLQAALKWPANKNSKYPTPEGLKITPEELATTYNNFYEFSLDKDEVHTKVKDWKIPADWKVDISGFTETKSKMTVAEIVDLAGGLEERVYRFRCVEGWSMVVPWTGIPLQKVVEKLKPQKKCTHLKFQSFSDSTIAKNIKLMPQYPWPYTEGMTLPEAENPLTFLAVGMYGKPLPAQNGAPIRLVVPWKYGFKSIKSITHIQFTDQQPQTLWNQLAPNEYGFYANVNPQVDHPRWSQASERILDKGFIPKRKPTLLFNGYEKEVAYLYKNMDLKKNY